MKLLELPRDKDVLRNTISKIDYSSALIPNCTREILEKTCDEALHYGFAAVAVFPSCIEYIVKRLEGSPVNSQIAVGFPCGNNMTEIKVREAEIALKMGVKEVDMVMNLHKFFEKDYAYVENDVRQVVELAKDYGVEVKMIMEVGFLSDEQKLEAGKIGVNAGCAFLKTCTGFGPGRATVHDIALLLGAFGDKVKIKASGGIASLEDATSFIEMGVSRSAGRGHMVEQLITLGWS